MTAYSPNLTEAIDLGWFSPICHVFFSALHYLYNLLGNWGVAIVAFTILLKIILYPLAKSSAVAKYRTKKFQPAMNAIKKSIKITHKDSSKKL